MWTNAPEKTSSRLAGVAQVPERPAPHLTEAWHCQNPESAQNEMPGRGRDRRANPRVGDGHYSHDAHENRDGIAPDRDELAHDDDAG